MEQEPGTQIVRLTPEGRGAVAVLLVEGVAAAEQVGRRFFGRRAAPLASRSLNRVWHGHWGNPDGEEVVVCRCSDTEVEIHCHGGSAAAQRIIADLTASGGTSIPWREWIGRRETSRIGAEALAILTEARTERTAAILVDQHLGALEAALESIVRVLEVDDAETARTELQALVARSSVGLHLIQPWRVVLAGPPNVGKSSLINALVGYRRSIVFDQAGTTRDVVSVATAIDGWPIELSDTAGLRTSDDPLETAGIELAERQLAAADCPVLVFDATERWIDEFDALVRRWPDAIVAYNKADLLASAVAAANPSGGNSMPRVLTSAVTGQGVEELAATIVRRLASDEPQPGDGVPFSTIQVEELENALEAIEHRDLRMARSIIERLRQ